MRPSAHRPTAAAAAAAALAALARSARERVRSTRGRAHRSKYTRLRPRALHRSEAAARAVRSRQRASRGQGSSSDLRQQTCTAKERARGVPARGGTSPPRVGEIRRDA
eukprot:6177475-Pleurochrysis_carterae.AAC.4